MRSKLLILISAAVVAAFCGIAAAPLRGDDGWVEAKNKNGITVYLRNSGGSKIRECKGVVRLEGVTLSSLLAVLDDTESSPQWQYNCSDAKVLKRISLYERVVYIGQKFPFGLMDRDLVIRSLVSQDPASKTVNILMKGEPEYMQPVKGRLRMPKFSGHWVFRPLKAGTVELEYYVHMDLGGNLPSWMVNLGLPDATYRTLLGFKAMVYKEKYRSVLIPQVKEP